MKFTDWNETPVARNSSYFERPGTEPITVRILTKPFAYKTHFIKGTNGYCGSNLPGDCGHCKAGDATSTRYVVGLYNYDAGAIQIWSSMPNSVYDRCHQIHVLCKDDGGITGNDVMLSYNKAKPAAQMYTTDVARKNRDIGNLAALVEQAETLIENEVQRIETKSRENNIPVAAIKPLPGKKAVKVAPPVEDNEFDAEDFMS